jgi:hypothetical protein
MYLSIPFVQMNGNNINVQNWHLFLLYLFSGVIHCHQYNINNNKITWLLKFWLVIFAVGYIGEYMEYGPTSFMYELG